jgi:hypothetical protein
VLILLFDTIHFDHCFLGDTFDILALINNSVNFLLYCFMSRAFRDTFKQTFCGYCQKLDRRESTVSLAHVSQRVNRKKPMNQSMADKHHLTTTNTTDIHAQRTDSVVIVTHENKQLTTMLSDDPTMMSLLTNNKLNGSTDKYAIES